MKIVRIILTVALMLLSAGAASGFLAQSTLTDSEGFADDMAQAIQQPEVQAEVVTLAETAADIALAEFGDQGGVIGGIVSGLDLDNIKAAAGQAVQTPAFQQAWQAWALLLHQGLADYAQGIPNDDVSVSGSVIEVRAGPLITPLLSGGIGATFSGLLDSFLGDRTISVDTGKDLTARLQGLGWLAASRWAFAAGAAVAFALILMIGQARLRWISISLGAVSIGLLGVAVLSFLDELFFPDGQAPELASAISKALTGDWPVILGVGGILFGAAAVGVGVTSRRREEPIDAAPVTT